MLLFERAMYAVDGGDPSGRTESDPKATGSASINAWDGLKQSADVRSKYFAGVDQDPIRHR